MTRHENEQSATFELVINLSPRTRSYDPGIMPVERADEVIE